ncbi:MAG: GntR family transcriptional regulator [Bacteroidales bacterium]|nr:GntR family transcriptional regulator [Bacteroidales bacterium]
MTEIGKYNNLRVVKELDFGVYLDGGEKGEILLPIKQVPPNIQIDEFIEVFIYNDSEDRIIATTKEPFATVDEFVLLKTADVTNVGAFLNWGLEKDLLVPFSEQKTKFEIGRSYIVRVYLDKETNRIAASAKLDKFLDLTPVEYSENQKVDLLIQSKTDLGYKAIINNSHWGMLYKNEVFKKLNIGDKEIGYIKKIREDNKIDLYLNKTGYNQIDSISANILKIIEENNGYIAITDKTSPKIIYDTFQISKKNLKKAIGNLYKNRLITIENDGIRLT